MKSPSAPALSQQILERLNEQKLATKSQKAVNNLVAACAFLQRNLHGDD